MQTPKIDRHSLPRIWFAGGIALVPALLLAPGAPARAQDVPGTGRAATNIAAPNQGGDSFLGQDRTGPYVLTYRKFLYGPGYPVWVVIDGRRLNGAEYSVDATKGEVSFAVPVKRGQLVRVAYGYYPEMVERNPNPALAAPLTFNLTSLGIGDVKLSAVNGVNGGTTPSLVLGVGRQSRLLGGGLTTQFLLSPDRMANGDGGPATEQGSVKLGYAGGNAKNGVDVGFQRAGRAFAQGVGRNFGQGDAIQNLNVGGRLNPNANTSLSYNKVDNRNLLGLAGTRQENAALRLAGGKGRPALDFSRSDQFTTDAKGVVTGSATDKGSLGGNFGALDLAYKTSKVETAQPNNRRAIVTQDILSANVPAGKGGRPGLGFTRTEDGKVDVAGNRTDTTTDVGNVAGKLGATAFLLRNTRTETQLPGNQRTSGEQQFSSFSLPGSGKPFRPALNYTRIDDQKIDAAGNRTEAATDQGDLSGKFGIADVVAKINRTDTTRTTGRAGLVEQQSLGVKVPQGKQPGLGYQRTGDVKIDAAGTRVGTVSDRIDYATKFSAFDVAVQSIATDVATPDRNRTRGSQDNVTLKYAAKGAPSLAFSVVGDDKSVNDGAWFGATNQRFSLDHRLGPVLVGLQYLDSDVVARNQRRATGGLGTLRLATAPKGNAPALDFQRQTGDSIDPNAQRTGILSDQIGLAAKLAGNGVKATAKQSFTEQANPLDSALGRENAFTIDRAGKRSSAAVTLTNGMVQTGRQNDVRQGVAVTLKPMPTLALGFGQNEQAITPTGATDPNRVVTSQTASAEVLPLPGTRFYGARTANADGASRSGINDLAAKFGTDKTVLKLEGSVRDRYNSSRNAVANADTAAAAFQVRPAPFLTVTGNYTLNPEDPKKPGTVTPIERREYGLKARLGAFELGGTYAANELLPGTPADVIAKAGGAPNYGEMGLTLGMRFGANSQLTGGYKDTFFNGGATAKGLATYTLGFTHNLGARFNFSLNGSFQNNRAIADPIARTDYKAEAKLGLKF